MKHRFQIFAQWQLRIVAMVNKYRPPEEPLLLGTAVLVGLGAGIGAVIFRWLINVVTSISFEWLPAVTSGWGAAYLILAPTVGGLLVGLLVYNFAPEAKGHGVPEVMEAVVLKGGRIRPIVAVIKSLASALSIGTGGSVGREGPIVQIGSALGSTVGQLLKLSDNRIRNLVASGAAGGIAATFNAPIAGVIFALEVILGNFSAQTFGTVVVAAVTSSVVGRAAFGDVPAFIVPEYAIHSLWEFPMYLLLGILAAFVAAVYTRRVYWFEDLFDAWKAVPEWVKPAVGGALLGAMALLYGQIPGLSFDLIPQIFGVGYETIEVGLLGQQVILVMLTLMVLKILATAVTLGSGGSGGVFAPSLFIGSMLGGSFGLLVGLLFPGLPGPPGAYALVGMGAVFAGSTHAPITAVIIMFEMTSDYNIILPLMLAVVASTFLSQHLMKGESIYTLKLSRRGIRLQHGQDIDVLDGVRVDEVMTRNVVTVLPDAPLELLTRLFLQTNRHAFPVLDSNDRLSGIVSLTDLRNATVDAGSEEKLVRDIMTHPVTTVYPHETLATVLKQMGPRDLSRLPVVSQEDPNHLVGVVRRNDVIRAYNLVLTRRDSPTPDAPISLRRRGNAEFVEVDLPAHAACVGFTVAELSPRLPSESLLVNIRRVGGQQVFPHGNTRLEKGDRIIAYVQSDRIVEFRTCIEKRDTDL